MSTKDHEAFNKVLSREGLSDLRRHETGGSTLKYKTVDEQTAAMRGIRFFTNRGEVEPDWDVYSTRAEAKHATEELWDEAGMAKWSERRLMIWSTVSKAALEAGFGQRADTASKVVKDLAEQLMTGPQLEDFKWDMVLVAKVVAVSGIDYLGKEGAEKYANSIVAIWVAGFGHAIESDSRFTVYSDPMPYRPEFRT